MRLQSFLVVGCVLVSGCFSNYHAYGIDTACVAVPWFVDADGDGWGEPIPAEDGTFECFAPPDGQDWVRNNRDCDDAIPNVTGRIGSLCPSELVTQGADGSPTEFTPRIQGEEFVVVHEATPTVWPGAARDACGPYGWGRVGLDDQGETQAVGHVATFDTRNQLEAVVGEVSELGGWAGWVGFRASDETWGSFDLDNEWVVDESADVNPVYCDSSRVDADDVCDPDNPDQPEGDYDCHPMLALVLDSGDPVDEWCLGTPDDVVADDGGPDYGRQAGHFICERPSPNPAEYAICPPDVDCVSGGDTGQ